MRNIVWLLATVPVQVSFGATLRQISAAGGSDLADT